MKLKTFGIFASSIIAFIAVMCIVFSFIIIPAPFKISEDPSSITVYNNNVSTVGKTVTKTNAESKNYDKLLKAFVETTNLSIFERAVSGANIYSKPTQDIKQELPTWSSIKNKYVTIELSFKNKQSIVVSVEGNTKKIDFYGLALVVEKSNFVNDTVIYYKTTSSYTSSPIIINANTSKLYKIITSLEF